MKSLVFGMFVYLLSMGVSFAQEPCPSVCPDGRCPVAGPARKVERSVIRTVASPAGACLRCAMAAPKAVAVRRERYASGRVFSRRPLRTVGKIAGRMAVMAVPRFR